MAVSREPIVKKCRTLGIDPACMGYDKKSNRNPLKANKKISNYGMQLKEKQKVKFYYGLLEKQFRNYYTMAGKMRGNVGENMLSLLERRLDNVVFKMGIGKTRAESRQIVNHGQITINGKRVDIPSYLVCVNDVIAIKDNKKDLPMFKELKEIKVILPKWLEFNAENLTGKINALPQRDDVDASLNIKEHLIIELYSK